MGIAVTAGGTARADLVLNLDSHINGATPADPTPWVTLDFHDVSPGVVELTVSNHLSTSEYLSDVLFNSSIALNASSFTYVGGQPFSGLSFGVNGGNQIEAGVFGVDFTYPTPNGGGRLSGGLNSIYDIHAAGLTAQSFDVFSTPDQHSIGTYLAATEVRGIPDGSSGSIGTTMNAVPEPSTALLITVGFFGVLAHRRFGRRGRA
jgi:hypothetical protein